MSTTPVEDVGVLKHTSCPDATSESLTSSTALEKLAATGALFP